jgi:arylsulfatase A-like enzyme
VLFAVTTGVASSAAEVPPQPPPAAPPIAAGPRKGGVVLVTIDSLRPDHVGCYTRGAGPTPALDALAARGVRFARAYAASVSTGPSTATILTGLWPAHHGWRRDGGGRVALGTGSLARRFQAAGYSTAAVVGSSALNSQYGLQPGFDRYDDDMPHGTHGLVIALPERTATDVVRAAWKALDAMPRDRPFFLWINFNDPRFDYNPRGSGAPDKPYDEKVAAADAGLGALVSGLEALGLTASTTILVAGSHGEGLGDHGEIGHGSLLYETTARVPLMVAGPGVPERGAVRDAPVSLVNVAATVLDLSGIDASGTDGVSLKSAPAVTGEKAKKAKKDAKGKSPAAPAAAPPVFIEAAHPYRAYGWSALEAVIDGMHKVVRGARTEAFDLAADPLEEHPLTPAPAWAADLRKVGEGLIAPVGASPAVRARVDAATAKVHFPWEGSPVCVEKDDRPDPRDPERKAAAEALFRAALDSQRMGPGFASIKAQAVLKDDPANLEALDFQVVLGLRNRWGDMLLEPLELMVCDYPYESLGYHRLGHLDMSQGKLEAALQAFNLMLAVEPGDQEGEYDVGCTLDQMGRSDEALVHVKRSVELGGDDWEIIARDPSLRKLQQTPEFQAWIKPHLPPS